MATTIATFETVAGTNVRKIRDASGRIQRYAEGTQIDAASYAAYKSHTPAAQAFSRETLDVDSAEELGAPYKYESTQPHPKTDPEDDIPTEVRERNAFVSYWLTDTTPEDKLEAAEQYYEMIQALQEANTMEKRQEIRENYGVGESP